MTSVLFCPSLQPHLMNSSSLATLTFILTILQTLSPFSVCLFCLFQSQSTCPLLYARQKPHLRYSHKLFWHLTCSGCFFHPLVSIWRLSCLHQTVYKPSTTPSSNTSLFPADTLHWCWLFSDWPEILSAHNRSSQITSTSPECLQHTPLYVLCLTNMLPSSPNSPGASLHQIHGFPPPSVHFDPPSAIVKTRGAPIISRWSVSANYRPVCR